MHELSGLTPIVLIDVCNEVLSEWKAADARAQKKYVAKMKQKK